MNPQQKARIERSQDKLVNAMERAVMLRRLAEQALARMRQGKRS